MNLTTLEVDEDRRLAALRHLGIIDVEHDERLDELVAVAAELCRTPIAAVSVVAGDRLWSKAMVGADPVPIPRDLSFCAQTILHDDLHVIEDTGRDPLFATNPLVLGDPGIAFYAGVPLVTADGVTIGALQVMDSVARRLEPWQLEVLRALGRQAMSVLEVDRRDSLRTATAADIATIRRRLVHIAHHDPLTGLPNRRNFRNRLDPLVAANIAGATSMALLLIDIDNFKDVNESLGHEAGDRVLTTIADRLRLGARGDDVVARLSGDEFAVLMPDAPLGAPEALAERLLRSLSDPIQIGLHELVVTQSIGIARWHDAMVDGDGLIRSADVAMFRAKEQGRNCSYAYDCDAIASADRRLIAHMLVRAVMAEDGLRLAFQPLWSLQDGRALAHEGLLRWRAPAGHSEAGDIDPSEFVAAAEEMGLAGAITRFTVREGCRLVMRRRTAGETNAAVTINLSSVQLERDDVLAIVRSALDDSGLDPSALIIELTESARLIEGSHASDSLYRLHEMGVRLALDDFGTGFSSVALLRTFPFEFLKIDRRFVSTSTEADRAVLASLVSLGHALGMTVVAEGIEDVDVLEQLRLAGCDVAQGFLLGRPGSAEPPMHMGTHPLINTAKRFHPLP